MEKTELYKKALKEYGFEAQSRMVDEERAELINALCKYKRGRANGYDVITEIADVMICANRWLLILEKKQ